MTCECMSDLLGHYGLEVQLGPGWRPVLCPFHDDTRPSATANHSGFKCYACGLKGDCYNLIMKVEDVDFAGATALHKEFVGTGHRGVPKPVTRKSWGIPPFGSRNYDRDDAEVPTGVRRRPPFGG